MQYSRIWECAQRWKVDNLCCCDPMVFVLLRDMKYFV